VREKGIKKDWLQMFEWYTKSVIKKILYTCSYTVVVGSLQSNSFSVQGRF
jgi:hypothetical protein